MNESSLYIVKPKGDEPEHRGICAVDGEAWPCRHHQTTRYRAFVARESVLCTACGKRRNACSSLTVERTMDDRTIYFHWRKACRPKAKQWWDENVQPFTGEGFIEGRWIDDLARHIGLRCKLNAVKTP